MDTWMRLAGAALVGIGLVDVFLTVLYARSDAGVVTPWLSKGGWRCFRLLASAFGPARRLLLTFAGPLLLVGIAVVWIGFLVGGFALIYWPELGSGLIKSQGPTPTGFLAALYYSGFCLSTLGVGDIAPATAPMRLLTVLEAIIGFSFFTLAITYFLSIYNALQQRNTLASILHHKTHGTGDPREWLQRLAAAGLAGARGEFAAIAERLSQLLEAHTFYPILHYFHFHHPRYSLPRMIFIVLDTASLLASLPLPERQQVAPAQAQMQSACRDLLERVASDFVRRHAPEDHPPTAGDLENWCRHHRQAARRLREAGRPLPPELATTTEAYVALRRDWHPFVVAFSLSLGYELAEVIPGP